jgi:hypothetical protein
MLTFLVTNWYFRDCVYKGVILSIRTDILLYGFRESKLINTFGGLCLSNIYLFIYLFIYL